MSEDIRILVVEDSIIQAEMLRRMLTGHGYAALVAKDGDAGLKMAREHRPHLIISDISMPRMDGYELCHQVKSDASLHATPVILLTELSDPKEIIRGLTVGADNYLTKPYDESELLDRIQSFLQPSFVANQGGAEEGLAVDFAGEEHVITSNRQQILGLLLSTYENAVRRNQELIKTQRALRMLNESLEEKVKERTRQLEEANRIKSEFVANISHETRTPMNAIIGMTSLALEECRGDVGVCKYLQIVKQSADSLLVLLNSLLDFSRLEVGELELQMTEFPLRAKLKRVCLPQAERAAREKGLGFSCRVDGNVPDRLVGDIHRLGEVLVHLLDNAIKFTNKGMINIAVTLAGREQDGRPILRFAVSDSGIGIAAERKPTIFESFAQGDGSRTRRYGGTGLGLSLVKRLVELMQGEIGMESEEGKGSLFYFSLPFKVVSQEVAAVDEVLVEIHHQMGGESDPLTMEAGEARQESFGQMARLKEALAQGDGEQMERLGQWLRKAASGSLDNNTLKEEIFRFIMAARKEDYDKARAHLEKAEMALLGKDGNVGSADR